jgi:hypothetical protein
MTGLVRGSFALGQETYIAIPYNDPHVQAFEVLIDYVKNWKKK